MANEVIPNTRGEGEWVFQIYNPSLCMTSVKGWLFINKDHHIVFDSPAYKNIIVNIPSQNVAFVYNKNLVDLMHMD